MPAKGNVGTKDFGVALVINCFFAINALTELSAALWALPDDPQGWMRDTSPSARGLPGGARGRLIFLSSFYEWRSAAPIISTIMTVLLVPLPFVVFGMIKGAAESIFGWKSAPMARQVADVLQPLTLLGLIAGH